MLWELAGLMFGPGKLRPEEYFMYKLYDDERYTREAKKTFVGFNSCTVPCPWAEISQDKPTMTALMEGLGLPVPETQAVVHPTRSFGSAKQLKNREDIRRFLTEEAQYPVFGKPFDSVCSLGTANLTRYDSEKDELVLATGQTAPVDTLIDQIDQLGNKYLFQSLMRPHPAVVPIVGDRVCTVRMFVLSDDEGCELLRASWKIPVGNGADNFWRRGNVLAGIDVETGKIVRALRRTETGTETIHEHPVTGHSFDDLVFPHWDEMREVVLQAAVNLPGCWLQGWDVALTDQGPVLVELEGDGGDPIMEQLCFDSGLYQGRYKKFKDGVPEMLKQRKQETKKRVHKFLKKNFAELLPRAKEQEETGQPAGETIDPEEVRDALQPEGAPSEETTNSAS